MSSDPDKHLIEYAFKFEPVFNDVTQMFSKQTEAIAQQYWCTDENETRFILTQIEEKIPGDKLKTIHYEEAFVIVGSPEQPGKCLIYYFTNFGCPSSFIYDKITPKNITLSYLNENSDEERTVDE